MQRHGDERQVKKKRRKMYRTPPPGKILSSAFVRPQSFTPLDNAANQSSSCAVAHYFSQRQDTFLILVNKS
jgi:hypothetical protein